MSPRMAASATITTSGVRANTIFFCRILSFLGGCCLSERVCANSISQQMLRCGARGAAAAAASLTILLPVEIFLPTAGHYCRSLIVVGWPDFKPNTRVDIFDDLEFRHRMDLWKYKSVETDVCLSSCLIPSSWLLRCRFACLGRQACDLSICCTELTECARACFDVYACDVAGQDMQCSRSQPRSLSARVFIYSISACWTVWGTYVRSNKATTGCWTWLLSVVVSASVSVHTDVLLLLQPTVLR